MLFEVYKCYKFRLNLVLLSSFVVKIFGTGDVGVYLLRLRSATDWLCPTGSVEERAVGFRRAMRIQRREGGDVGFASRSFSLFLFLSSDFWPSYHSAILLPLFMVYSLEPYPFLSLSLFFSLFLWPSYSQCLVSQMGFDYRTPKLMHVNASATILIYFCVCLGRRACVPMVCPGNS